MNFSITNPLKTPVLAAPPPPATMTWLQDSAETEYKGKFIRLYCLCGDALGCCTSLLDISSTRNDWFSEYCSLSTRIYHLIKCLMDLQSFPNVIYSQPARRKLILSNSEQSTTPNVPMDKNSGGEFQIIHPKYCFLAA